MYGWMDPYPIVPIILLKLRGISPKSGNRNGTSGPSGELRLDPDLT